MPIDYSGNYSDIKFDDLLVLAGYTTSYKFLRIRLFIYIAGFLLLLVFVVTNYIFSSNKNSTPPNLYIFLGIVCFITGGVLSVLNTIQRRKKIGVKRKITGQISDTGNTVWIDNQRNEINWDKYEGYRLTGNLILLAIEDNIKVGKGTQTSLQIGTRNINFKRSNQKSHKSSQDLVLLATKNNAHLISKAFFTSDDDWNMAMETVKSKLKEIDVIKPNWRHWLFIIIILIISATFAFYSVIHSYSR